MHTVSVDGVSYVREPFTGVWTRDDEGSSEVVDPSELLDDGGIPDDLAYEGIHVFDGEEMHRFGGMSYSHELMSGMTDGLQETGSARISYWIGVDDPLLRRMYAEARDAGEPGDAVTLELLLYDYGEEFGIEAPVVAGPMEPVEPVVPPLAGGLGCDEQLQSLLRDRPVDGAQGVNSLALLVGDQSPNCGPGHWNPVAVDSPRAATGCFGKPEDDEQTGPAVGGVPVPPGLRASGGVPVTGRDGADNLLVHWSDSPGERPSDGAACWLYVRETDSFSSGGAPSPEPGPDSSVNTPDSP